MGNNQKLEEIRQRLQGYQNSMAQAKVAPEPEFSLCAKFADDIAYLLKELDKLHS